MSASDVPDRAEVDLQTAGEALSWCSDLNRDKWIRMGMALKAEFGEPAFEIWDRWSSSYVHPTDKKKSYSAKNTRNIWHGFRGRGFTIGTLIHEAMAQGFRFNPPERTEEDKAKFLAERNAQIAEREAELIEEKKQRDDWRLQLSDFLTGILDNFEAEGYSEYLEKKKVPGFGLLFPSHQMLIIADEDSRRCELITDHDEIKVFWKIPKDERPSFRHVKHGMVAVPLYDIDGRLWNMQLLYKDGGKSFFAGRKRGCFHVIGQVPPAGRFNICEVEGYSNGACIHVALGCPVVVAFDAGNLAPVAVEVKARFGDRINRYAFCADDDKHLEADGKKNDGKEKATEAARLVGGLVVLPDMEPGGSSNNEIDALFDQAVETVTESNRASVSGLQRRLKIGYNRAAKMIEEMERRSIVSHKNEKGIREVLNGQ